jgi:hypothetical protein
MEKLEEENGCLKNELNQSFREINTTHFFLLN